MIQNYANIEQELRDVNMDNLVEYSKKYTPSKLIALLKKQYPCHWQLVYQQLALFDKGFKKLPTWAKYGCFFTQRALEQASSEGLAAYKASLFNGKLMLDLCGGFGVDDTYFGKSFQKVISIDANTALNELVRFNWNKLGSTNLTRIDNTAEAYLNSNKQKVDLVYIDADRRPDSKGKIVTLEESTPNVLELLPQLQTCAEKVLLKLSPMIDLTYLKKVLPNLVVLEVVGIKNEVKEVLAILDFTVSEVSIPIKAVQVNELGEVEYSYTSTPQETQLNTQEPMLFFYEPSVMLIKAGLSKEYAKYQQLSLIASQSHYMLGGALVPNFFGRSFKVVKQIEFSKSTIKAYIKEKGITKAHVSARNFVDSVDGIRKTFKLEDGGDDYLFFSLDSAKTKWMWHTVKV